MEPLHILRGFFFINNLRSENVYGSSITIACVLKINNNIVIINFD